EPRDLVALLGHEGLGEELRERHLGERATGGDALLRAACRETGELVARSQRACAGHELRQRGEPEAALPDALAMARHEAPPFAQSARRRCWPDQRSPGASRGGAVTMAASTHTKRLSSPAGRS